MASASWLDPFLGAALIDAAGTDTFAPLLLDAATRAAHIDEIFAYRAATNGPPHMALSISKIEDAAARADNYVREFHRFDPVTRIRATATEANFVVRVSAADLAEPHYKALCFDGPHFADKLCFGARDGAACIVLSFYRSNAAGEINETALRPLANLALSILAKQSLDPMPLVDRIEHKLAYRYPQLTPRERQVCARTIAGWTADQSAADLGIRHTTVLTYRQRAYQRLGFRSAADFLDALLH